jgi:hypothetical protein
MKFFRSRWIPVLLGMALLGLSAGGCSRLLPPRKGTAGSFEMVLDTRRAPSPALSGCYIPAVFPAVTKIPVVFTSKIPPGAVFTSVSHEVVLKEGEISVLESVIEDNQVYLKFSVPTVEGFSSYHVMVRANYEYRW